MANKIMSMTIALSLAITVVYGANGVIFNVIDGDIAKKYTGLLDTTLEKKTGFTVSDSHERVDLAYAKRYGDKQNTYYDKEWRKNLDNLGFYALTHDKKLNSILKDAPEIAVFSPFNQLIYKSVDENKTYVGHMNPQTMLDIVGIKDEKVRKDFIETFIVLDKWTENELGGVVKKYHYDSLPSKTMMNFEVEVDKSVHIDDFIATFEENFESSFEDKKYIIAGYKDFKETYEELDIPFDEYDKFSVYSLCHFTFSYNLFNKGRPDAGVFAPCSMYMYIKKDSNKLLIGMPTLANWVRVMNIKDTNKLKWIKKIDSEIISIMESIGAKQI